MKKLFILPAILLFIFKNFTYSQIKSVTDYNSLKLYPFMVSEVQKPSPAPKMGLGVHTGFAFEESSNGFAIGLLAEIALSGFSVTPQANYWKVNQDNNFEMAGLMRLKFPMAAVEPYLDGGIGINFLDQKDENSLTKLGVDIGGGVEFPNVGSNYSIFIDGKYKIIIKDNGNISGYTLTGGIKFSL